MFNNFNSIRYVVLVNCVTSSRESIEVIECVEERMKCILFSITQHGHLGFL